MPAQGGARYRRLRRAKCTALSNAAKRAYVTHRRAYRAFEERYVPRLEVGQLVDVEERHHVHEVRLLFHRLRGERGAPHDRLPVRGRARHAVVYLYVH